MNYPKRYDIEVWDFGGGWQNVVNIRYEKSREDMPRICLPLVHTKRQAISQAKKWCSLYEDNGPDPYGIFRTHKTALWPTLYSMDDEESFLSSLFHGIGGGSCWLDGAVVDTDGHIPEYDGDSIWGPCSPEENDRRRNVRRREMLRDMHGENWEEVIKGLTKKEWKPKVPREVYPASKKYSLMYLIPDDVKPDWFNAAYKAALIFKERLERYGVLGGDDITPFLRDVNILIEDTKKRFKGIYEVD